MKSVALLGRAFAACLRGLPAPVRYGLGDILGWLWFDVFRIRRRVVLDNLTRAFPDWDENQKVKVGRRSLFHLGRDLVEYAELPRLDKHRVEKMVQVEGWEHIEKARAQGKGVCLLTLHLGNGDLAVAALSILGLPMYLISKEFKLKWLNDLWFGMRAKLGTRFIPPRNSSYSVLKALKKQGVVVFVLDQFTGPPIGVKTKFFGHETGTGLGLAMMADRAECPVVPAYTYRIGPERHVIRFGPEIPFERRGERDESLAHMTQKYNDVLESYVRQVPEQWMWIHKRWKIFRVH